MEVIFQSNLLFSSHIYGIIIVYAKKHLKVLVSEFAIRKNSIMSCVLKVYKKREISLVRPMLKFNFVLSFLHILFLSNHLNVSKYRLYVLLYIRKILISIYRHIFLYHHSKLVLI